MKSLPQSAFVIKRWFVLLVPAVLIVSTSNAAISTNTLPLNRNSCIIFLGDSITAKGNDADGFVSTFFHVVRKEYLSAKVFNAGRGFDRLDDLRERYDKDVKAHRPTVVIIQIGINNIVDEGSESELRRKLWQLGLDDLVWRVKRDRAIPVLTTLTPSGEMLTGQEARDNNMEAYNEIIKTVADENDCHLLDFRTPMLNDIKTNNPENKKFGILTTDGAHLNAKGNRILADNVFRAFGLRLDEQTPESTP
ncbi:MAG: lysophospholipase L1-like esterase [Candidatus Promineifilaceae bacterium]